MIPVIQRTVVLPAIEWLRSEPISRCLREMNRSQWYSRYRLRALQWEKLRILVEHSYGTGSGRGRGGSGSGAFPWIPRRPAGSDLLWIIPA